jgi:hypothetical protein
MAHRRAESVGLLFVCQAKSSGNFATFAAIRRASTMSLVTNQL